jgi:mRNA interferase RelE/StbE
MYTIILPKMVQKQLDKIPENIHVEIVVLIQGLALEPLPPGAKKLRNFRLGEYRLRVGNYRVIYDVDVDAEQIHLIRVMHRRDVYRMK